MHTIETISIQGKNREELLLRKNGEIVALTWLRYENEDCIIDKMKYPQNKDVVKDLFESIGERAKQRGCSMIRTNFNPQPGLLQMMGYNRQRISVNLHGQKMQKKESSFLINRPDTIKDIEYMKKVE